MLGFYAYMPDITVWLRLQPDFPFKQNLLELDAQTLQLVVFAFLLFIILAKVNSPTNICLSQLVTISIFEAVHCRHHLVLLRVHHSIDHGTHDRNNYRSHGRR